MMTIDKEKSLKEGKGEKAALMMRDSPVRGAY